MLDYTIDQPITQILEEIMSKYSLKHKRGVVMNSLKRLVERTKNKLAELEANSPKKKQLENVLSMALQKIRSMEEIKSAGDLRIETCFPLSPKALSILREEGIRTVFSFVIKMTRGKNPKKRLFRRLDRELRPRHPKYIWYLLKTNGAEISLD